MAETILIIKKRGQKIKKKITKQTSGGYVQDGMTSIVNLYNFKDLALFLHDLDDLWGAPIEKAVKQYLLEKEDGWPF